MDKREWIEGGLVILGVGFVTWGAICLIMNIVGWLFCVVAGNAETVGAYFVPDLIRSLQANVLQCAAGYCLVTRNRQIASYAGGIEPKK